MKLAFLIAFILLFTACDKKQADSSDNSTVEIFLLTDFETTINTAVQPAITVISNAKISDEPIVRNEDIIYYSRDNHTFKLNRNIEQQVKDHGPDKGFAVTVNRVPVYTGTFHPSYLSSIRMGIATIDPFRITDNELQIDYFTDGSTTLTQRDKRNDPRLTNALMKTGRLR